MPNRDGTGPQGGGPKTGRGLGNCNTNDNKKWQGWVVAAILLGILAAIIIVCASV